MPAIPLFETVFESLSHINSRRTPKDGLRQHLADILTILSLTFASVSVLSTLGALYWFVKMKRNFRHELVTISPVVVTPTTHIFQVDSAVDTERLHQVNDCCHLSHRELNQRSRQV